MIANSYNGVLFVTEGGGGEGTSPEQPDSFDSGDPLFNIITLGGFLKNIFFSDGGFISFLYMYIT